MSPLGFDVGLSCEPIPSVSQLLPAGMPCQEFNLGLFITITNARFVQNATGTPDIDMGFDTKPSSLLHPVDMEGAVPEYPEPPPWI